MAAISDFVGSKPPRPARAVSLAVRQYLRTYLNCPPAGVVFAVSGGADSLALVVAGADLAERMKIPYTAAIVDHQMRPESSEEANAVADKLRVLGVREVMVLRTDSEPASTGFFHGGNNAQSADEGGPEAKARSLRHRLLTTYATDWGNKQALKSVDILFGHTMEDQAETVLLRLSRGASTAALAAIRPRTSVENMEDVGLSWSDSQATSGEGESTLVLWRGRPLLGIRRFETLGFCEALGLTWVEDPSNRPDGPWRTKAGKPLPRSALRHDVLPAMRAALGQDPVPALARVAAQMALDEDALTSYGQAAFAKSLLPSDSEAGAEGEKHAILCLDVSRLQTYPTAVLMRALLLASQMAKKQVSARGSVTSAHLQALQKLVVAESKELPAPIGKFAVLPGGITAQRKRRSLVFRTESEHAKKTAQKGQQHP